MIALLTGIALLAQDPELRRDPTPVPRQPFVRYVTKDKFNREITFYVGDGDKDAPLVLFIQGSGSGSNFVEIEGKVYPQNGQVPLHDLAKGKIRLIMVEKPGVKFLDKGAGGIDPANAEFKKEHTLDRWSEACGASLRAARRIEGVNPNKIMVVGHSEGGLVACRVAAQHPFVTHVATLAGGGVTQLYDLMTLVRKGVFAGSVSDDPEKRIAWFTAEWKKVLEDPDSADKLFLGHPNRRWSSFLSTSPVEELAKYNGKIYIAQGVEDSAVDISSADALHAQLLSRGKDVTYDRVKDGDHMFGKKDDRGAGWTSALTRLLAWFAP